MLLNMSGCSMFHFQFLIFDIVVFILLFYLLNLYWLKILQFVNNHGRNCTKKSESQNTANLLVIFIPTQFFKVFIYSCKAQIMVGRKHTTKFYLSLLKLACMLLKIEVYIAGPTTRGGTPSSSFFRQKFSFFFFSYIFPVAVLLFQT